TVLNMPPARTTKIANRGNQRGGVGGGWVEGMGKWCVSVRRRAGSKTQRLRGGRPARDAGGDLLFVLASRASGGSCCRRRESVFLPCSQDQVRCRRRGLAGPAPCAHLRRPAERRAGRHF